jgi:hypothetical protein
MHKTTVSFARSLGALGVALAFVPASAHAAPTQERQEDLASMHASAATLSFPSAAERLAPVVFYDQRLQEMVQELTRRSPTVAAMLRTIQRSGMPLAFGSFPDVAKEMADEYSSWDPKQRMAAGFMAPVVRKVAGFSGELVTVKILVAVNLAMLDDVFRGAEAVVEESVEWAEIQRLEMLSVLAHEIVHAYGLALSEGDPREGCHDPEPGERPADACVLIGENLIRKEIGAPLDWEYGFHTLDSLAKRYAEVEERRTQLQGVTSFDWPSVAVEPLPLQLPARQPIQP